MKEINILLILFLIPIVYAMDVDIGIDTDGGDATIDIETETDGGDVTYNFEEDADNINLNNQNLGEQLDELDNDIAYVSSEALSPYNIENMITKAILCMDGGRCSSTEERLSYVFKAHFMTVQHWNILMDMFRLKDFQNAVLIELIKKDVVTEEIYFDVVGEKMQKYGYVTYNDGEHTYNLMKVGDKYDLVWIKQTKEAEVKEVIEIKEIIKPKVSQSLLDRLKKLDDLCEKGFVGCCESAKAVREQCISLTQ